MKKGERGMEMVMGLISGATDDEDEAKRQREKTERRERRDEAAIDRWYFSFLPDLGESVARGSVTASASIGFVGDGLS